MDATALVRLVGLRRRALEHAVEALAMARDHAARMQGVLDEQLALVGGMQDELHRLDERRSLARGGSVEALTLAASRRRWLVFDLEKEEFYLPTMHSDVERADAAVEECLAEWRRLRARLDAFAALGERQSIKDTRREERRAAAGFDDRRAGHHPAGATRTTLRIGS